MTEPGVGLREIAARAPTRIDLGGGWTDVPPYCDREGGFVCNVAIARYATVRISSARRATIAAASDERPLVRAALARAGVSDVVVRLENDFPIASGLGGSSSASAALLSALDAWRGLSRTPAEIAEEGRRIEVEDLGVAGGRQDHYAATHGGALALTFSTGVAVRRIPLSDEVKRALTSRSILLYTGQSRISGDTITAVLDAYLAGERRVVDALHHMKRIAMDMATHLERGDIDAIGELLSEHWRHQRALHPSISTPRIEAIIAEAARAGAPGAKAMGASGGGCVLIVAGSTNAEHVRRRVAGLGELLDFEVDEAGVSVRRVER